MRVSGTCEKHTPGDCAPFFSSHLSANAGAWATSFPSSDTTKETFLEHTRDRSMRLEPNLAGSPNFACALGSWTKGKRKISPPTFTTTTKRVALRSKGKNRKPEAGTCGCSARERLFSCRRTATSSLRNPGPGACSAYKTMCGDESVSIVTLCLRSRVNGGS